jgi:hypothetical protein
VRRNVSPAGYPSPIRIVDVEFPPGARVATRPRSATPDPPAGLGARGRGARDRGGDVHRLGDGDCVAFELDRPVVFHNPGERSARYAVILAGRQSVSDIGIRRLVTVSDEDLDGLAGVLVDCVAGGASVSFMAPLTHERARAFWAEVAATWHAATARCSSRTTSPASSAPCSSRCACRRTSRTGRTS